MSEEEREELVTAACLMHIKRTELEASYINQDRYSSLHFTTNY